MERSIPDPLTVAALRRDPDLIFAVHARGRRMRSVECGQMLAVLYRKLRMWSRTQRADEQDHAGASQPAIAARFAGS